MGLCRLEHQLGIATSIVFTIHDFTFMQMHLQIFLGLPYTRHKINLNSSHTAAQMPPTDDNVAQPSVTQSL